MSFWTAVVIMAIVWGIVAIYTHRADTQRGIVRDEDGNPVFPPQPRESAADRREIEDLRERIKVLERIATDSNTVSATETRRIASEIEALRDRQDV